MAWAAAAARAWHSLERRGEKVGVVPPPPRGRIVARRDRLCPRPGDAQGPPRGVAMRDARGGFRWGFGVRAGRAGGGSAGRGDGHTGFSISGHGRPHGHFPRSSTSSDISIHFHICEMSPILSLHGSVRSCGFWYPAGGTAASPPTLLETSSQHTWEEWEAMGATSGGSRKGNHP